MPKRTDGVHTWEFKNVGEGPMEVWLLETTCSCTVATLKTEAGEKKKVTVPPGESIPIEVNWETRDWNNFGQTATLGTNDPDNHAVMLTILGTIIAPVDVQPSETIAFPEISNEETHRASLTILSPDHAGLKLTKIVSSKPGLIVTEAKPMTPEELKTLKVKSGYTLAIEVKPGMPAGPFREELVIQTDHPDQSEVKVTIAGTMTGPITIYPEKLEMLNVASREGASREFSLMVRGGRATHFEVARASAKVKVAIVRDDSSGARGRYRLTATVPPGTPPGVLSHPIVLKTDHPQVNEVEIPVSIYISRANAG